MTTSPRIRVGCCGFPLSRAEYFRLFTLVEVQQTFYQPPAIATLRRWREQAPPGFEFTLKAWQLVTHEASSPTYRRLRRPLTAGTAARYGSFKPTEEVARSWRATREAAQALEATAVVFQCPASFAPTPRNLSHLRGFFRRLAAERNAFRLCWEPRGDWPRALLESLCRELGLDLVVDPFATRPPRAAFRYFRLHGVTGYRHRYSAAELARLLQYCRGTTYCLFNNASMVQDAARFAALLAGRGIDGR
jgi:uncharacterized protein YecE (DUF72 family)